MIAFLAAPAFPGGTAGTIPHSRGALALAILGHVIGAFLMVKLLEIQRPRMTPPIVVEILEPAPEVKKELPPPRPKPKPLEPKVEQPPPPPEVVPEPPPQVMPEPLPQMEAPPPPPAVQPVQRQRQLPLPDQIRVAPQPEAPLPPVVPRPVETVQVQAPPPPQLSAPAPRTPVPVQAPPPILTAREPAPVPTAAQPARLEQPVTAPPPAPRVAPREPPRRPLPVAAPVMEIAAAPMAETASDIEEPAPPPFPIGPVPEGEINLDADSLTALYLRNPKPGYPAASRRLGEQGTVLVRAFINKQGEPKSVELKKSSGYPRLDRAALEAIKGWKFVPAKRDDQPVEAAVIVPMKFSLNK